MIAAGAFAVFALGLRHGADPDHLAAIDNVTRNAYVRSPRLSRFVGTLFAGGHSVMVLAISALVGLAGTHFGRYGAQIETAGTAISIVVLLAIAAANLAQLRAGGDRPSSLRARLVPRRLRESENVLLALPIGFLFGFGFETSSQIAAYTVAFGTQSGVAGALLIGAMFCVGMVCTDTLDSLLVHRLLAYRSVAVPSVMRVWIASVTVLAVGVAAYEAAQLFGWTSPIGDLGVSGVLVGALGCVFGYVVLRTRRARAAPSDAAASTV